MKFLSKILILSIICLINTKTNGFGNLTFLQNFETRYRTILSGDELVTEFDLTRGLFSFFRQLAYQQFDWEQSYRYNLKNGKTQPQLSNDTQFPCDLKFARSTQPPRSVHSLRPGDIDIIAAMGDSMTAGTCVMTETAYQLLYENRGITFSGGGYGSWRQFLTLPNILKVFNPKLYGYAISGGLAIHHTSRLNVAEPAAMSRDLVYQAKILIQRMKQDPNVDMKNHWKLLTILIGNVDYCGDLCMYDDVRIPLQKHESDLRESLTLLRNNVPRLFVNLIPAPDSLWILTQMKNLPIECYILHHLFCVCVINATRSSDTDLRIYEQRIRLWQELDEYIANLPEFNTEDFTVVAQPFFESPEAPLLPNGEIDLRFFAADCFHFSQLGQAGLANSLWNNMLQAVGEKQLQYTKPFEHFECPTEERPYLATMKNRRRNSRHIF